MHGQGVGAAAAGGRGAERACLIAADRRGDLGEHLEGAIIAPGLAVSHVSGGYAEVGEVALQGSLVAVGAGAVGVVAELAVEEGAGVLDIEARAPLGADRGPGVGDRAGVARDARSVGSEPDRAFGLRTILEIEHRIGEQAVDEGGFMRIGREQAVESPSGALEMCRSAIVGEDDRGHGEFDGLRHGVLPRAALLCRAFLSVMTTHHLIPSLMELARSARRAA